MEFLRHSLERISPLSPQAWTAVAALCTRRTVPAGQALLRAGTVATKVLFVETGLLREYYVDQDGREATRRFCKPGEFSGSLADLLAKGPSAVEIEALSDADLIDLEWSAVDELTTVHPSLMLLLRRFAEGLYVQKMRREHEMLTLPAAERYRRFAASEPMLNQRLPRHMVASYLGITPVHLSRIAAAEKPPKPASATQQKK